MLYLVWNNQHGWILQTWLFLNETIITCNIYINLCLCNSSLPCDSVLLLIFFLLDWSMSGRVWMSPCLVKPPSWYQWYVLRRAFSTKWNHLWMLHLPIPPPSPYLMPHYMWDLSSSFAPPAVKEQSLNHWTARKAPGSNLNLVGTTSKT